MPSFTSLLAVLTPEEETNFWPDHLGRQLRGLCPNCRLLDPTGLSAEAFAAELSRINPEVMITCWSTPALPAALPAALRYVCHLTGSVRHLVRRAHLAQGLLVTNWGNTISRTVAECALYHVLACLRRGPHWTRTLQHDGGWRNGFEQVRSLFERRVGVHGYGAVARELLKLLAPFGCTTSVCAPDFDDTAARTTGAARAANLDELFSGHDIIIEVAPLNSATKGCVTEHHLRLLPPGAVFVNVARAAIVDEAALLLLATEGQLRVGLDVFVEEPLPAASGFRQLPEVSLTPHIAGPTLDRYSDATAGALRNLQAYAAKEPLSAVITLQDYDQAT
jgi:phosphoglycerate dehydrogenase-like enzyme